MKHIAIPEDVLLVNFSGTPVKDADTGEQAIWSFLEKFLVERLMDDAFGKSAALQMVQHKILAALDKCDGKVLSLEDADHKVLLAVADNPSIPYHPVFARCYFPAFYGALKNATDELPESQAAE